MARRRSDSPVFPETVYRPDFSLERQAMEDGRAPVAGLDEAGRGPLAGPVVAAAVVLDPDRIPDGLDDSKRLLPHERAFLFEAIMATARSVSAASVCAGGIDATDIRKASLEAMRRAVAGLCLAPVFVLVDGRDLPPGLSCTGKAIVRGDQRCQSIAAASIVAKVTRDRMMARCGAADARYGLETHMGYATAAHRSAISAHGPIARLHRLSFAPFRK